VSISKAYEVAARLRKAEVLARPGCNFSRGRRSVLRVPPSRPPAPRRHSTRRAPSRSTWPSRRHRCPTPARCRCGNPPGSQGPRGSVRWRIGVWSCRIAARCERLRAASRSASRLRGAWRKDRRKARVRRPAGRGSFGHTCHPLRWMPPVGGRWPADGGRGWGGGVKSDAGQDGTGWSVGDRRPVAFSFLGRIVVS